MDLSDHKKECRRLIEEAMQKFPGDGESQDQWPLAEVSERGIDSQEAHAIIAAEKRAMQSERHRIEALVNSGLFDSDVTLHPTGQNLDEVEHTHSHESTRKSSNGCRPTPWSARQPTSMGGCRR